MGCGCGGKNKNKLQINSRPIIYRHNVKPNNIPILRPQSINTVRKCTRCGSPMVKLHRYNTITRKNLMVWSCVNQRCLFKITE